MENNHINYVEFTARNLQVIATFYSQAFGWKFTDYGPEYIAFDESGLSGGFAQSNEPVYKGALIILYHQDLERCQQAVESAGGTISIPIFSFPGGKRFHFLDPAGNELAVWSDH